MGRAARERKLARARSRTRGHKGGKAQSWEGRLQRSGSFEPSARRPGSDAQANVGDAGTLHRGGPAARERGGRRAGRRSFPAAVTVPGWELARRRLQLGTYPGSGDEDGRWRPQRRRLRALRLGPRPPRPALELRARAAHWLPHHGTASASANQRRAAPFGNFFPRTRARRGHAAALGLAIAGKVLAADGDLEDAGCSPHTRERAGNCGPTHFK